jgi:hypothetical protein
MRYARALIPTLKEAPSDATSLSHVLLLRAGYARRIGAGVYADLARREIKSYRDLPKNLYQVQTKSLENGGAELKLRRANDLKQSEIVGLDRAAAKVFELVQQALRVPAAGEAA